MYVSAACFVVMVFFFKQKTAYEMRISDWSSDVCSSDLAAQGRRVMGADAGEGRRAVGRRRPEAAMVLLELEHRAAEQAGIGEAVAQARRHRAEILSDRYAAGPQGPAELGRASCRERGGQYV